MTCKGWMALSLWFAVFAFLFVANTVAIGVGCGGWMLF